MALRPFRIEFTERALADLRERLSSARWPSPLPGAEAFDATLRVLARDWARLDWAAWQARLNDLPHLRGVVEGGEVHAVVLGGSWTERRPALLLLHDAAGTFFDRLDLAQRLARPPEGTRGVDVVLASLPGTGYSERLDGDPMPEAAARRLRAYMTALGYERYAVHGDGYGASVAGALVVASGGAARDLGLGGTGAAPGLAPAGAYALHDSPV
ncbi:MAG: epoxide hydrolase N-terminal domain-containing protein, partial [Dehalococcoidia bacterium]|nr:epoxide hydrolase N-terminal domain-containing protein [Dehalococcoidia bacterium]